MQRIYSFIYILLAYLLTTSSVSATHMVGGEINYRCLGNNMYEISLTVFRDCDTGVPWFDDPASIGIFDINDSLLYDLRIPLTALNDTLEPYLANPCYVIPPNVCIHTTTYVDTIMLPFQSGGYQVVYQRCCRNQDIVNIVNPLGTGATYYSYISEEALLGCNNSAVFNEWPPVYICQGVPIAFDHSATDIDGDSIVYELCAPFTGATPFQSQPQPPNNPPYDSVIWQSPYNTQNMMGQPDPLEIDPNTGLLTGTPYDLGVFVVGVCAREYRNGVLISTTKRDFQYVVGICGQQVLSAFFAPEVQCDNSLIVSFDNNSQTLLENYTWDFGDTTTTLDVSTLENPVYIYPDTGLYTVTLIADPGTPCTDTFTRDIYLQYESILMDFDIATLGCSDSLNVQVTDLTIDSISNITHWEWDFGNGDIAYIPFASTTYTQSGTYTISLEVEAANGCIETLSDSITINLPQITDGDTVVICDGVGNSIQLNQGGDPNLQYQWSPATGLSSTTAVSPIASPTQNTIYTVTITAFNGFDTCVAVRDVTVLVEDPFNVILPNDTITCSDTVVVNATSTLPATFVWAYDSDFLNTFDNQNPVTIPTYGVPATWIYVQATSTSGCVAEDSMLITQQNIPLNPNFDYTILDCADEFIVQFNDLTIDTSQGQIINWFWDLGNGTTSTLQNPIDTYTQSGSYVVGLLVTSENFCTGVAFDTLDIAVPTLTNGDTLGVCFGQNTTVLNPNGDPNLQYQWSPATGLSSITAASPTVTVTQPIDYTVTITAIQPTGDTCEVIKNVHVNFAPQVIVDVPPQLVYCGNTVTLTATTNTGVDFIWAGDPSFATILGTGNPVTLTPTTFPFAGYYVQATDANGCTATDFVVVEQQNITVNPNFVYQSLGCSDTIGIQFTDLTADTSTAPIQSWNWVTSDGQSSTLQHPIFTFTQSQNVFVTLTVNLANGCSGTVTQVLDLNLATITSPSEIAICDNGNSITLNPNGNPNLQYQWSPANGLNSTTAVSPVATPPSLPFTYTVTATGFSTVDTCINIYDITIVDAPPLSLSVPSDTTFCAIPYQLSANATTGPGVTLQWSFSPTFASVALTNVNPVSINFASPSTFTLYARVIDQYGCSVTDTAVMNYSNTPVNVDFTANVQNCSETLDVTFTDITADTLVSDIYAWAWDFSNGTTANSPVVTTNFTGAGPHTAQLYVELNNGCFGNAFDTLYLDAPTYFGADSIGLCGADSVMLNPSGNPNWLYQWSPITGLSDPNSPNPMVGISTNTLYTVTITAPNNGDTCETIQEVMVFADSFSVDAMPDTVLCGNQLDLIVNVSDSAAIQWALDNQFNLIIGQGEVLPIYVNDSRWFYVRGENAFGCESIDSVFIEVKNLDITAEFVATPFYCGDSLVVDFLDITADTVNNPIVLWDWDLGNGATSDLPNPSATYFDGNYTVEMRVVAQNGCAGISSQDITVALPVIDLADRQLCDTGTIGLNPNGNPNLVYNWSPSTGLDDSTSFNPIATLNQSASYTVEVEGYVIIDGQIDTCITQNTIDVTVLSPLTANIQGDTLECDGILDLSAILNRDWAQINWADNAQFAPILASQTDNINASITNTSWIYLEAVDSAGCVVSDSIFVEYSPLQVDINQVQELCSDEPVLLETIFLLGDSTNVTYDWSPTTEILTGLGTSTVTVPSTELEVYTLIVEDANGCTDTVATLVEPSPDVLPLDIIANPDTILLGETSQLEADFYGTYIYNWTNATTLDFDNIHNPVAQPNETTTYYLTVTNDVGCVKTDSITIWVRTSLCGEPNIFIPNAFTPDGDGVNDILFVRGDNLNEVYLVIYDRWGELVFETNNQSVGWDGYFRGELLNPDVYGYYLECTCGDGETFFKKGNITLIR